jgi:hypothetical protein
VATNYERAFADRPEVYAATDELKGVVAGRPIADS